jgi:signal transduction histidine kinase
VATHAQASMVEVKFEKLADEIRLTIKDDGKSFDVKRALHSRANGRLGLLGMRERLEMVGGKFTVKSPPDQGTTVTARVPLTKSRTVKNGKPMVRTKR